MRIIERGYVSVLLLVFAGYVNGQTPNTVLSVESNYTLESSRRVTRVDVEFTYRANITNSGVLDYAGVGATLTSLSPHTDVIDGELTFNDVPAGSTTPSVDSFTIRQDRRFPFNNGDLVWMPFVTNEAPIAMAGEDFNALTQVPITLDGSRSYDPEGEVITFEWVPEFAPDGSLASLTGPTLPNPAFVPDLPGDYGFSVKVNDGQSESELDHVVVSVFSTDSPPNADAGRDQNALIGETVTLDGSGSSDPIDQSLSSNWALDSIPPSSSLTNADIDFSDTEAPEVIFDAEGPFDVRLQVDNGSQTDTDIVRVNVSGLNTDPIADAGPDQIVNGDVNLDGTGSIDPDGGPAGLGFGWDFVYTPPGSVLTDADIQGAGTATPTYTPDIDGPFISRLTVDDGNSTASDNVLVLVDLTQPTLGFQSPGNGDVVTSSTPTFNIAYDDAGTGIDLASYRTFINGVDVTASTNVMHSGATYTPTSPLPPGDNEATAIIADNAGNVSTETIRFTISVFRAIADCGPTTGTAPLAVKYRSKAEFTEGSIVRYRWDFQGDGTFDTSDSVARDFNFTFQQQGTFPAVLEVTNNLGEVATDTCEINVVGNLPTATASATPSNGPLPLEVAFTGQGSKQGGSIVLHEWDFDGDGVFDSSEGGSETAAPAPAPTAITFYLNHATCGSASQIEFYLNNVSIGTTNGTTACICNTNEPSFTVSDSSALANWNPTGTNTLRAVWGSGFYAGYIRAELTTAGGNENVCVYDKVSGNNCAIRDLCAGFDTGGGSSSMVVGDLAPISISSSTVQHTYTTQGIFNALYRVTDNDGQTATASVTTTAVRVGPPGSPTVQAIVTPSNGGAPLIVNFDGSATDDGTIVLWEWDFEGDGTFDFSSPTSPATTHTYINGGVFAAALRVTDNDGLSSVDFEEVIVDLNASLTIPNDTFDPSVGGKVAINTSLTAGVPVRVLLKDANDSVVRTLVNEFRSAGSYTDDWDGNNDAGQRLPQGPYYVILEYDFNGKVRTVDLTDSTGGVRYNPSRNRFPSSFSPFEDDLLTATFTVPSNRGASEIQAFVGLFRTDTRFTTLLDRVPLGVGTHTIYWDGLDQNGDIAVPPPGDSFLFGIWGFTLSDNAVFLQSAPDISNVMVDPNFFDPSTPDFITPADPIAAMSFDLDRRADVELTVTNLTTGRVLRRIRVLNVPAGTGKTVEWNGRADSGLFVDKGDYRLTLRAIDTTGSSSLNRFALVRVFY